MSKDITRAVRRRRIKEFYEFMKKIAPEKVELDTVTRGFEKHKPVCGSVGCVMGWAPAVPILAKAGAYWGNDDAPKTRYGEYGPGLSPLLGIHNDDADWLFETNGTYVDQVLSARYNTKGKKNTDKQQAINRLRFLLELDDMNVLPMWSAEKAFMIESELSDDWENPRFKGHVRSL